MRKNSVPKFLLMGGLGNQLFQLAAALAASRDQVVLIDDVGNPRLNALNKAEILSLALPERVTVRSWGSQSLIGQKIINLSIRVGARSNGCRTFLKAYLFIANSFCYLSSGRGHLLNLNAGVGDDTDFIGRPGRLNIGYFQTSRYILENKTQQEMMSLRPTQASQPFIDLLQAVKKQDPIVVHIRLGDYLLENSFGVPSPEYYGKGLSVLSESDSEKSIWLFSNDPETAICIVPAEYQSRIFIVPLHGLSSAETLELMRYGSAYLLANSTFSWWGAMLSFTKNPHVIIPTPWFKSGGNPLGIYPPNWNQIAAGYDLEKPKNGAIYG